MHSSNREPIPAFFGEYRFLSNFAPIEVYLDGATYPSVEHAYQAAKFDDNRLRRAAKAARSAGKAKRFADDHQPSRSWSDVRRLEVMADLVCGFSQVAMDAATVSTTRETVITELFKWSASRMASVAIWDLPSGGLQLIDRAQLLDGTIRSGANSPLPAASPTPVVSREAAVGWEHTRLIAVTDAHVRAPTSLSQRWVVLDRLESTAPASLELSHPVGAIEEILLDDERQVVGT